MTKKTFLLCVVLGIVGLCMTFSLAYAQENEPGMASRAGAVITGRVLESKSNNPLEYANVMLLAADAQKQISGAATNKDGSFFITGVKPGMYRVEFSYMGFNAATKDLVVDAEQSKVDMGTVRLERSVIWVEGVQVIGDEPEMEFKIDKKVINVSKTYTSASGTAVDVLENAPSVSVDIEGNVSLRGSTNFTVLIDNRPTLLEPSDALQQIPASSIENIEIITNPSAKYDPEGVAGIINVVTKKKKLPGINGTANLNLGLDNKYGGDFRLNYRKSILQTHIGVNYDNTVFSGTSWRQNVTTLNDTAFHRDAEGETDFGRKFYGIQGGIDVNATPNDIAAVEFEWRGRNMIHSSVLNYDEWTVPGDTTSYISEDSSKHGGYGYSINTDYNHTFNNNDHRLALRGIYSQNNGDEQAVSRLLLPDRSITYGQRSIEKGPSSRARLNVEYSMPVRIADKLESGYQLNINRSETTTETYQYDTTSNDFVYQADYSHSANYAHYLQSAYATYSGEYGSIGYQTGLRSEYSHRDMRLIDPSDRFLIDRWDVFPTAHLSYKLPADQQAMASYTRRIHRPHDWDLEPFLTWMDAYTVRQGNPALLPEYINSYELGYQKRIGRNTLSLDTYYRQTLNKIDHVSSVYSADVMLNSVDNVGSDRAYGAELMMDYDLFPWFNLNLTGNLYQYHLDGVLEGDSISQESNNWSARLNSTLKISSRARIQVTGFYNSPTVTAQGERRGFIMTNSALKIDVFRKLLTATVQVRDIFNTGHFEFTSQGDNFYSHNEMSRRSPVFMLALNYSFNNYKPDRVQPEENQEDIETEDNFQN
ncbi:MAG TPA: TonB-dependent receptor [bacterium]